MSNHKWCANLYVVITIIAIAMAFSSCRSQKITTQQTIDITRSAGYIIDEVIYDTLEYLKCPNGLQQDDKQQAAGGQQINDQSPAKTIRTTHRKVNISLADTAKATATQETVKETHISHSEQPGKSAPWKIFAFIVCLYLMALAVALLFRHNH